MKHFYKIFCSVILVLFYGSTMAQYCNPSFSYGCGDGDGVTLFQLGTINQSITCTAWYHDYTASSTNLSIGNTYTITIQAGYSSTYVNFYIDYNHNTTFDATELIGQVVCASSATNYTLTFTVPGTALTGSTRLRAITNYTSYPAGPCSSQTYGNCEDFSVNIAGGGYCALSYTTGCSMGDGLTNFTLNTINQAVACNGAPNAWYHDWTGTSTSIMLNTPYTLSVTAGYSSTYVSVWIDYNNDNTFSTNERVVTDLICVNSGVVYSATINVPLGTNLGNHRMRFRTNWSASSSDPCLTYSFGNAGDFTVNLLDYVPPSSPTVVTTAATTITGSSATLNGTVNANNASTTVTFEYGLTIAYGNTVPGVPATVNGSVVTNVSGAAAGLAANTLYHYRVKGVNSVGTSNGNDMTFTTQAIAPVVVTTAATGITNVVATLNGTVNANNSSTNVFFDWGLTAAYGNTATGVPSTVNGTTITNVSANLTGLTIYNTYHYRVRGVNSAGSTSGADMTFYTDCLAVGNAGTITGPAQVCNGGTGYVFSIPTVANASGYNWSLPFGAVITSGSNTNSITVNFPNQSYSGNVTVYAIGCAGNGFPSSKVVNVNPAANPTLTGPNTACSGVSGNVYTTQTGMSNYIWNVDAGGVITAGGTTTSNTITVTWVTPGTHCVTANYSNANGCAGLTPASFCTTVNALPTPTITGNASPCATISSVYTTQTGMSNYVWVASAGGTVVSGNGTSSATVVWNTTGSQTLYVTCTNSNGCTNAVPASLAVTVKQSPAPTISGSTSVCINSGYSTYTTQTGMTGYTWTVSPGGTIVYGGTTNTISVNWTGAGAQTVTVNYTNGNGCAALNPAALPVFVTDVPGPAGVITGISSVCEGGSNYAYSVAPITNAHSYVWTLPAGATVVSGQFTNNITVNYATGASSGNITVFGNSTCGNGTTSPAYPVNVSTLPVAPSIITGPGTVCAGTDGVQYSVDPISGATGYVWVVPTGGTIVSGANTNQITVNFSLSASSGNVSVYGTNSCGNGITSNELALTINAIPPAPVVTCYGMQLSSDASAGNQWYRNGTTIAGATGQTYDVTQNGTYWDVVILSGCSSAESNHVDIVNIGFVNTQQPEISVYPVPNDGFFHLTVSGINDKTFSISVVNDLGIELYCLKNLTFNPNTPRIIDLRPIPAGVYSLIISSNNTRFVKRIVIK